MPIIPALQKTQFAIDNLLRGSLAWGATRLAVNDFGALTSFATRSIAEGAEAAVAKAPVAIGVAADATLLYGLYTEIRAIKKGTCKF